MHELLDIIEFMAAESKANEGGDALQKFYYELYKPDEHEVKRAIQSVDTDSDFDSFAALGMQ